MAATIFPAPSGELLPINTSEKVAEGYTSNGYFSVQGLPAGRYAVQVEGAGVNYLNVSAPGQALKGRGNTCYIQSSATGEISGTAASFGDSTIANSTRIFNLPSVTFSDPGSRPNAFQPGSAISWTGSNYIMFHGAGTIRLWVSGSGALWELASPNTDNEFWQFMGETGTPGSPGTIADTLATPTHLFAIKRPGTSAAMYRTSDLTGRTGWSNIGSFTGWNFLLGNNGRIFLTTNDGIIYSDNQGSSWTNAGNIFTGRPVHSIVRGSGNVLYAVASNAFSTTTADSLIYKSTNNGETWSLISTWGTNAGIMSLAHSITSSSLMILIRTTADAAESRISTDDGATWSAAVAVPTTTTSWRGGLKAIWDAATDLYVIASPNLSSSDLQMHTSPTNSLSWTLRRTYGGQQRGQSIFKQENGLLFYYGQFNNSGNQSIGRSSNPINAYTDNQSEFNSPNAIAFTNNNFVITTTNNAFVLVGPTLSSLTLVSTPVTFNGGVAAGNGVFLAHNANNNTYYTSTNGTTWTLQPQMHGSRPCFIDGKFFRRDSNRVVWTSLNGVDWTFAGTLSSNLASVTLFKKIGDAFYAFGESARIGVSLDLTTWTESPALFSTDVIRDIEYSEQYELYYVQRAGTANLVRHLGAFSSSFYTPTLFIGTGTTSPWNDASNTFKAASPNGALIVGQGVIMPATSNTTSYTETFRYFAQNWAIFRHPNSDARQLCEALGAVFSLDSSNRQVARMPYGRPAAFAIYRVR